MSKTNIEIAHDFFHSWRDSEEYRYSNVSYSGDKFYSYSTLIAYKGANVDGERVLLVSRCAFSNTTQRHIANVISASPLSRIYVPFRYGYDYYGDANKVCSCVMDRFVHELNYYIDKDKSRLFRYVDERRAFNDLYLDFVKFLTVDEVKKPDRAFMRKLDRTYKLYEELSDKDKYKTHFAKVRASEKRKAERLKKLNQSLFKKFEKSTLMDSLRKMYETNEYGMHFISNEQNNILLNFMRDKYGLASFIMVHEDKIVTSQRVAVKNEDVIPVLKRYLDGNVKIGQHVGAYVVNSISDEFVQVGCHKIPVENIMSVAHELGL